MKYLDIKDVKTDGQFVKAICFKPRTAPIICVVIGILLLIPDNLYVRLLGMLFVIMSYVVFRYVDDFKVMDIYDKGILFYEPKDSSKACFVSYDEISMWAIRHDDGHDTIEFTLDDGSLIINNTFDTDRAYHVLYELIKEKEERYIQHQKNKDIEFNIPNALNNIKKKFYNRDDE